MREESDHEILEGIASGSRRSFRQMYERHGRMVLMATMRLVKNHEDAEEATQDAFMALMRLGSRAREIDSPRAWLLRVASNRVMDQKRRLSCRPEGSIQPTAQGRENEPPNLVPMEQLITCDAVQRENLYHRELNDRISARAKELPERQMLAFSLRHFQGMTLKEVAEVMECSVGAVKAHLHIATAKIRIQLVEDGILAPRTRESRREVSNE
ncbi:MAG: sigma-70 family RNA polymerase sigma factor [Candidatus Sumerlaeia bacterium]|nr:sigma-70 family RNA polymerase sigma factor [Candidatus Sumerlaeia bacterium]